MYTLLYFIYNYCIEFLTFQGELITVARNHETMIDLDLRYLSNGRNTSGKKTRRCYKREYINYTANK